MKQHKENGKKVRRAEANSAEKKLDAKVRQDNDELAIKKKRDRLHTIGSRIHRPEGPQGGYDGL